MCVVGVCWTLVSAGLAGAEGLGCMFPFSFQTFTKHFCYYFTNNNFSLPPFSVHHASTWCVFEVPFFSAKVRGGAPSGYTDAFGGDTSPSTSGSFTSWSLISNSSAYLVSASTTLLGHIFLSFSIFQKWVNFPYILLFVSCLCGLILFSFCCCHFSVVSGKNKDKHMFNPLCCIL